MSAIPYNGLWIVQGFTGNWDVIKKCGAVVANDLSLPQAYTEADNATA